MDDQILFKQLLNDGTILIRPNLSYFIFRLERVRFICNFFMETGGCERVVLWRRWRCRVNLDAL
ncbi:putative transcription factor C3H family [Helianthus annuus]|nr:putative transcription factor C3H family [Helianthus annuus]